MRGGRLETKQAQKSLVLEKQKNDLQPEDKEWRKKEKERNLVCIAMSFFFFSLEASFTCSCYFYSFLVTCPHTNEPGHDFLHNLHRTSIPSVSTACASPKCPSTTQPQSSNASQDFLRLDTSLFLLLTPSQSQGHTSHITPLLTKSSGLPRQVQVSTLSYSVDIPLGHVCSPGSGRVQVRSSLVAAEQHYGTEQSEFAWALCHINFFTEKTNQAKFCSPSYPFKFNLL